MMAALSAGMSLAQAPPSKPKTEQQTAPKAVVPKVEIGPAVHVTPSGCPDDMARFVATSGPFCVDRFEFPNQRGALPMAEVTYAEAAAQCASQGKRLCTLGEWQQACRGAANLKFPYGNDYIEGICRTAELIDSGPVCTGSKLACRGSERVFDMSGNVAEWVAAPRRAAMAQVCGGNWTARNAEASCAGVLMFPINQSQPTLGFRCCKQASR
jgi:formylglycine-generating enzyme required for sulfatase activity